MTAAQPTPQEALQRLRSGNERFRSDAAMDADLSHRRRLEIARGQRPFATLVGCSDSRVGPELLFGAGLGELFIVRIAGNIVGPHALGSIEFGVAVLATPLVVVLGHERCGAVQAAIERVSGGPSPPGAIGTLVDEIVPVVAPLVDAGVTGDELIEQGVHANVRATVAKLRQTPEPILRDPLESGALQVVGAYYDLQSGNVDFFDLGPHG